MRDSRMEVTSDIAALVERLHAKPAVLVQGSAIGVYGVEPGAVTEDSWIAVDGSFSQQLCLDWEREAARIGIPRHVVLRIGVVLDRAGGALGQMLVPTEFAGGTRLGSGTQRLSWISRDDLVRTVLHALDTPSLHGAVNAVTGVARNRAFTNALARALHRPAWLATPAWLLRRFGVGREILLADQAVRRVRSGPTPLDPNLARFLDTHLARRQPLRRAKGVRAHA